MGIAAYMKRKYRRRALLLFMGVGIMVVSPINAGLSGSSQQGNAYVSIIAAEASTPRYRTERVKFAKGATGATIEGQIAGYETVDYVLRADKGQYMNASMATRNKATYFNILAPGEDTVGFFNGSMSENQFEGVLPQTGDYRIRVYMMRSAARRGERANYRLEIIIGGR